MLCSIRALKDAHNLGPGQGATSLLSQSYLMSTKYKAGALEVTGGDFSRRAVIHVDLALHFNGFSCNAHSKENFQEGTQLQTSGSQILSH